MLEEKKDCFFSFYFFVSDSHGRTTDGSTRFLTGFFFVVRFPARRVCFPSLPFGGITKDVHVMEGARAFCVSSGLGDRGRSRASRNICGRTAAFMLVMGMYSLRPISGAHKWKNCPLRDKRSWNDMPTAEKQRFFWFYKKNHTTLIRVRQSLSSYDGLPNDSDFFSLVTTTRL